MVTNQSTANLQGNTDFQTILDEATRIKNEYVQEQVNWYNNHASLPMRLFRISGILIILLSVSLPFLATLDGFWKTIVLPIVALLVAALTGLTSFYRWESDWKGFRETKFMLEYLISVWDWSISQAKLEKDEQKAITLVVAATNQLLDATHAATSSETAQFFQRAQIPQGQQSQ